MFSDSCPSYCEETFVSQKYSTHANARNEVIAKFLDDSHEYVLWLDHDVVEIPDNYLHKLIETSQGERIVAPMVFIEKSDNSPWKDYDRFYDLDSFFDLNGIRFNYQEPYSETVKKKNTGLKRVESVGTSYLCPAKAFEDANFDPTSEFVEHVGFCKMAADMNIFSYVDTSLSIFHAFLPDYGEKFH